jgi:hypothetical protein
MKTILLDASDTNRRLVQQVVPLIAVQVPHRGRIRRAGVGSMRSA